VYIYIIHIYIYIYIHIYIYTYILYIYVHQIVNMWSRAIRAKISLQLCSVLPVVPALVCVCMYMCVPVSV